MVKDTNVIFRINSTLKENVTKIAHDRGVSLSELINACLQDIDKRGYVPLNVNRFLPPVYQRDVTLTIASIKKMVCQVIEKQEKKQLIRKAYIYGSYSRGEETPESDIDIRMEADDGLTLFDAGNIRQDIVEITGKEVDLTINDPENLDPAFLANIRKDEICIYERQ